MKGVAAGALRKDGLRHYKEIMLIGNVKKPYCALKDLCQNVPPARDTTPFTPIAITRKANHGNRFNVDNNLHSHIPSEQRNFTEMAN
jgi:hypothetical protein